MFYYNLYKVHYLMGNNMFTKAFNTLHEACEFANTKDNDSVMEIKYYEDSINNGSALWSQE